MYSKYLSFTLLFLCALQVGAQESMTIKHGPYLQNLGPNEVTVVWTTNRSSIGWVEIAPDDKTHFYLQARQRVYATINGVKQEDTLHVVRLTGLTSGTKYRYRVLSQEVVGRIGHQINYGKTVYTTAYTPFTFVTGDRQKPSTSFIMVNDIHGRSEVMTQMLNLTKPMEKDMVIFNGDMVSTMKNAEDLFKGFMDAAVKSFASNVPMYYARGNHETRGAFATGFQNYFSPSTQHLYYLVRQGPVCFVFLDCGEDKPDSDVDYYGITDYDNYRTQQAEWLKGALKEEMFTSAPFKIAICHMPPRVDWHGEAEVLEKFVPLLNEARIDLMLCGHLHRHFKEEPTAQVHFPVLINSNKAVVTATVTTNKLTLDVLDTDGKKVDAMVISK